MPSARKCNMLTLLRQRQNKVALFFALFSLAAMLLLSPSYQGLTVLRLWWENGRYTPITMSVPYAPFGGDFLSEWTAGYIVREGDRTLLYDTPYVSDVQHDSAKLGVDFDKGSLLLLFYPPAYYLLVSPLSLIPIQISAMIWACLMTAFLIAAAAVAARTCPDQPGAFAWCLFIAFLFFPLIHSLNTGQKGTLWLLIFTVVFALLHQRRPFAAGVVFGLLALKPPLAVALGLAMLWKRQWRFLGGCAISVLAVVGLSFAFGPEVFVRFLDSAAHAPDFTMRPDYPLDTEHTFYGFFALLLRGHATPGVIRALAAMMALLSLGVLVRLLRGPLEIGSHKFSLQFAGIVVATVLLSPKLLTYDLTIILLPIFLLARLVVVRPAWAEEHRTKIILAAVALFVVCAGGQPIARATHLHLDTLVLLGVLFSLSRVGLRGVSVAAGERSAALAGYAAVPEPAVSV